MNDQPSPLGRNDDNRSSSPKRKKIRQKYAPKACVLCRRSKLKCSGDNPCQRCRDNSKRCFYSEDQTAAEALQNLSRPSLSQQPSITTSVSNGSGTARRNIMPRHQTTEQRASDASALGLSMEARMARIEAMMETLLQDRAVPMTAVNSEPGSDMAMSGPILDPINPALALLGQPQGDPAPAIDPMLGADTITLRVGSRNLRFPSPSVYQDYINSFFRDLHCLHPCVDEQLFRLRSKNMLGRIDVHPDDACFLALNYMIFAWQDASSGGPTPNVDSKPSGWHWLQLADEVVGHRQLYGQGDASLVQFQTFKALYCALIDQPSLAYNTIGLASRYVLQQGLNRQSSYSGSNVWEIYERLRIFWNVLIIDRRISLSCGRPYTIRDVDVDVERPSDFFNREILSAFQPLDARLNLVENDDTNTFLDGMIHWSRFAGSLWDSLLAAHVSANSFTQNIATFDAAIADFFENTLPGLALHLHPYCRQEFVEMSFDNLRFTARRAAMMSLQLDGPTAQVCSTMIFETATHISAFEIHVKNTSTLRHFTIPSLSSSLLMICTLVVSGLDSPNHIVDERAIYYRDLFHTMIGSLQNLATQGILLAQRVLIDFEKIVPVVEPAIARWSEDHSLLQDSCNRKFICKDIPANVAELLPYREQIPEIRLPCSRNASWANNGAFEDADHGSSAWDGGLELGGARCSVLWI